MKNLTVARVVSVQLFQRRWLHGRPDKSCEGGRFAWVMVVVGTHHLPDQITTTL